MNSTEIRKRLFDMRDVAYRDFQAGLIPNLEKDRLIGVRTPLLRQLAKQLVASEQTAEFLSDLPHYYFDENQLHAFIISEMKDFDLCLQYLEAFLPYIDNWATCDQLSPKVFRKNKDELLKHIEVWLNSGHTYTIRFAIGMLMQHFLTEDYQERYPEMVSAISSDEYYVRMMVAWYFATALAKQYESILPYIEEKRLDPWTHNKTIQKAVESNRISWEQKEYLKSLKLRQ